MMSDTIAKLIPALLLAACSMRPGTDRRALAAPAPAPVPEPSAAQAPDAPRAGVYPPGRWRLVPTNDLHFVVLWVSHILIRHEAVENSAACFGLPGWAPSGAPPARTRAQALELARRVAREAELRPEAFAELARRHSEDLGTRDLGGSFGGFPALQWIYWPRVLDALAAIRPGEVSEVVETEYGFHVFQRRAPPPPETVSGSRIVIGYDQASWLHRFLARGPVPPRSRDEAWALAWEVYRRAQLEPQRFARWVDAYSEHQDALLGGDLGAWSTREPTPLPTEVEVLRGLGPYEISQPFDSGLGVQIVQRTPERARARYGAQMILRAFDPAAPDAHASSGLRARRVLEEAARRLARDPARFEAMAGELGGLSTQQWEAGRGPAVAERALAELEVGAATREPVLLNPSRYALIRRIDAALEPPPATRFELPAPAEPSLEHLFRRAGSPALLAELARDASALLALPPDTRQRFEDLHRTANDVRGDTKRDRGERWRALEAELSALLGPRAYARYRALLAERLEQAILRRTLP